MRHFPIALAALVVTVGFVAPVAQAQDPLRGKGIVVDANAPTLPDVWAKTWIIADAQSGAILAAKRAHKKRAPASTIKMLTALTVLPKLPLDSTYVARKRAVKMYGSRVGLIAGRSYTVEALMNAMMLPSANDAAVALAQANGGVRRTVAEMNAVAAQLNARDTVAKNPSGLDSPGMVSTAYDLAVIARAGLQQPTFSAFAKRTKAQFPIKGKNKTRMIYTTNRLLLRNYPGAIGVKTGYTSNAGRTFVGAAERDGRTLIVALMGINERSEVAAQKLLDWGFRHGARVNPVGSLPAPTSALPPDDQPQPEGGGEEVVAATEIVAESSVTAPAIVEASAEPPAPLLPLGGQIAIAAFVIAIVVLALRRLAHKRAGMTTR